MRPLFNTLAVSGAAAFAGVLLAIGVVLGGYWESLPATAFLTSFRDTVPFVGRVIVVVLLPTLAGIAGSLWLDWKDRGARALWLGAAVCIAVLLVLTAAWFAPTNARFAAGSLPLDRVPARLGMWLALHNLRIALATSASVLGVIALRRPATRAAE